MASCLILRIPVNARPGIPRALSWIRPRPCQCPGPSGCRSCRPLTLRGLLGSAASHTIMSYFDVDLTILTMLQGERRVNKPAHEERWYKPLAQETVASAVSELQVLLADAVTV